MKVISTLLDLRFFLNLLSTSLNRSTCRFHEESYFLFTKAKKTRIISCPKYFLGRLNGTGRGDTVTRKVLENKKGIPESFLKQIADATRIREVILKAIEEDKYEDLPHLYVKSFMSAYAKCLGLDPNEVIRLCQKYMENLLPSKGKALRHQPIPKERRVNVRFLVIFISGLFLALLVYASFKLLPRVFPSLWTEESTPPSSSSVPSPPEVQKEVEPPTAEQSRSNETQPPDINTDNEP